LFLAIGFSGEACRQAQAGENILNTAIIVLFILTLDEMGEEICLWDYPVDVIPLFPPISAIDLSACRLFIHDLSDVPYLEGLYAGIACDGVIFCFVCEPIFVFLGIYQTITWKYYYGFHLFCAGHPHQGAVGLLYRIADRRRKGTVQ
jgi:hypothetical protein